MRVLRVFVASPGDVADERDRVNVVAEELNRTIAQDASVRLDVIRWESHVAPLMGRPQQVVLDQLSIETTDIFIGILWHRFGSSTGAAGSDGVPFHSGTEEEFKLAVASLKERGRPQIMFYRCTKGPADLTQVDPDQLSRVAAFLREFSHDGDHPGLYRTYTGLDDFERKLRGDLIKMVRSLQANEASATFTTLPRGLQLAGFTDLFVPITNEARDDAKIASLSRSTDIQLIAHSGFSYLALVGHRFRVFVERRLDSGATVRVVLTNPWSEAGLFLALGEHESESFLRSRQDLARIDPVDAIASSAWYTLKLRDSMSGFQRLAQRYGEKVEVRFWPFEMPATVLITEGDCYWEPYLSVNLQERLTREMLTFEVRALPGSGLYEHAESYFSMVWRLSMRAEELEKSVPELQARLRRSISALLDP